MFNFIGRTSSAAHLRVFRDYVSSEDAGIYSLQRNIALMVRGAFKETGINDVVTGDKPTALKEKLFVLSTLLPSQKSKIMASQLLDTSHKQKKVMGVTPSHYSTTFLAGMFQMMGQAPDIEAVRSAASSGRGSKDFSLFVEYVKEFMKLFDGNEDMVLTSTVEDSLPDFIKNI